MDSPPVSASLPVPSSRNMASPRESSDKPSDDSHGFSGELRKAHANESRADHTAEDKNSGQRGVQAATHPAGKAHSRLEPKSKNARRATSAQDAQSATRAETVSPSGEDSPPRGKDLPPKIAEADVNAPPANTVDLPAAEVAAMQTLAMIAGSIGGTAGQAAKPAAAGSPAIIAVSTSTRTPVQGAPSAASALGSAADSTQARTFEPMPDPWLIAIDAAQVEQGVGGASSSTGVAASSGTTRNPVNPSDAAPIASTQAVADADETASPSSPQTDASIARLESMRLQSILGTVAQSTAPPAAASDAAGSGAPAASTGAALQMQPNAQVLAMQADPSGAADSTSAAPLLALAAHAGQEAAQSGARDERASAPVGDAKLGFDVPVNGIGAPASHVNADPVAIKLNSSPGTPEFPQALAQRVSLLADQGTSVAKLQVDPPQLGPIDVRIEVQGDKAQVWMSAHSVVTREALEASSPRLREMLSSQGFTQVNVDISQRSFQERTPPQPRQWSDFAVPQESARAHEPHVPHRPRALDAYA